MRIKTKLKITKIDFINEERILRDIFFDPADFYKYRKNIGSSTKNDAFIRFFIKFKGKNIINNKFRFFPKLK